MVVLRTRVHPLGRMGIALIAFVALGVGGLPASAQQAPGTNAGCSLTPSAPTPAQICNAFWTASPNSVGDNTYLGALDQPASGAAAGPGFTVSGWAVDSTAQGWAGFDQVQLYNGIMGTGGTLIAQGSVAQSRPDVAGALGNGSFTNSGFSISVPASANLSGDLALNIYVHSPSKGWWVHPFMVNVITAQTANLINPYAADPVVKIENPSLYEYIGNATQFTISGFAVDRNATSGAGVDRVAVYVVAPRGSSGSQLLGNATIRVGDPGALAFGSQFQNGGWSITFSPSNYATGGLNIYAYARSAITGAEEMAQTTVNIESGTGPSTIRLS